MKQNKYDDDTFFKKYSQMERSIKGLSGAGEWPYLKKMLPDFAGKKVLDLGCGLGWHCRYAASQGAKEVVGVDISAKMLAAAQKLTEFEQVSYKQEPFEDFEASSNSFDVVISSLAFHYIKDWKALCQKIRRILVAEGEFVFSVEHPVFTAEGTQQWVTSQNGTNLHWPVDSYFSEGERRAVFLDEEVIKYHRSLTTYVKGLIDNGFEIIDLVEPYPTPEMLQKEAQMADELRRPMMLLVSAKLKKD